MDRIIVMIGCYNSKQKKEAKSSWPSILNFHENLITNYGKPVITGEIILIVSNRLDWKSISKTAFQIDFLNTDYEDYLMS